MVGVVSAGHEQTAAAGKEVLLAGGNAFDGAIASLFAACVVEPTLTSLGGGGFLLAHQRQIIKRIPCSIFLRRHPSPALPVPVPIFTQLRRILATRFKSFILG